MLRRTNSTMTTVTDKPHRRRMSLATFLARPEPSGGAEELLDGELVVSPTANEQHSTICTELTLQLGQQFQRGRLGRVYGNPLTTVLDAENAPQPDLSAIVAGREHIVQDGYPRAAPDLAIEVLSPGNRSQDLIRKKRLYAAHGVREYWIVDGFAETVTRYWLHGGRYGRPEVRHRSIRLRILPQVGVDLMVVWRAARPSPKRPGPCRPRSRR